MKGMVFTEFLDMVEQQLGMAMADRIIAAAQLPNDGAYTAVGTYDHHELVRLVAALSEATGTPAAKLVRQFGGYLFQRFSSMYPGFFASAGSTFDFLSQIENYIHVEVRKLYPEAELPTFICELPNPGELIMLYGSPRGFADLAEGLIEGCIAHFGEAIALTRVDLPTGSTEQRVRFHLIQQTQ